MNPLNIFRRVVVRRRILSQQGVSIAPSAKVRFERINLRDECELTIGAGAIVDCGIAFERPGSRVTIGENTFIGGATIACAEQITIGSDVLVAWQATILDHDSHSLNWEERARDVRDWYAGKKDWTHVARQPVLIEDKCWIGFNATIFKGVTIGEGAVVAACSVVTKDVAPYTLVAGNPARPIRALPHEGSL